MKLSRLLPVGALLVAAPLLASPLRSGSDPAALTRGLEAIQPEAIRADLSFIASDELAGRDTPSQGLRLAARYLRSRMQRLGFTPAGDEGDFFAHYPLGRATLDTAKTGAALVRATGEMPLLLFEDYVFFSNGVTDLDLTAPVRFAGKAAEEELAGHDLTGTFALAFASDEVSWRDRVDHVRAAGAVGLITLPDPTKDEDGTMRFARRSLERPGLSRPGSDPVYPVVYATRAGVAKFLPGEPPAVGAELDFRLRDRRVVSARESHSLENVAALWPGADLAHEVIVVSAHYDHVGERGGEIWNGADDNGSGTCGLLALADALVHYGPMRRSILLLWVSGEEKGLLGSAAWTEHPTLAEDQRPVLNLNIDMIGRNAPDYLLITPSAEHAAYNALTRMAEAAAPLEGFPSLGSADEYWRRSDHMNFSENLGIPVAFLFSDVHEDYHQPTDTVDKIDFDKIRRVTRLVLRMMDSLQGDQLDL